jgi:DNA polymerase III subunit delta'
MTDLAEPDRVDGAPHPRATPALYGHAGAEAAFLDAFNADRLHHAWLITGPRGIGKATFAWRAARFLLTAEGGGLFGAPASLDVSPEDPVARRMLTLAEPRLFLLRRGANTTGTGLSAVIRAEEMDDLRLFLRLRATDGRRRAVIIDAADEMNATVANGLLKVLEEPPLGVTFLMVSHQPMTLLPTIRSRTRTLALSPLTPPDLARAMAGAGHPVGGDDTVALAALAGGSAGMAIALLQADGLAQYRALVHLMEGLPRLDRKAALTLADKAGGRGGDARFDLTVGLIDAFLTRAARTGAAGQALPEAAAGEAALLQRLVPDMAAARSWAGLAQTLGARARAGKAVNLDAASLVLDTLLKIEEGATAPAR